MAINAVVLWHIEILIYSYNYYSYTTPFWCLPFRLHFVLRLDSKCHFPSFIPFPSNRMKTSQEGRIQGKHFTKSPCLAILVIDVNVRWITAATIRRIMMYWWMVCVVCELLYTHRNVCGCLGKPFRLWNSDIFHFYYRFFFLSCISITSKVLAFWSLNTLKSENW